MQAMAYPFDAVLFDLDGVLVDTSDAHLRLWDAFARARGYAPTPADLAASHGRTAEQTIRLWLGDRDVAARVAEREAMFTAWLTTASVPAVAGAADFVATLRAAGVPCAVATSAVPANARLSLARIGLEGAFGAVVTAVDVRRGKPDPECWRKAAAALGVDPARCLVVEDSLSGLRAAKAAGARRLALATTFPREALEVETPEWVARDFLDLPDVLRP
jgi:beta-phosphoglucomutase